MLKSWVIWVILHFYFDDLEFFVEKGIVIGIHCLLGMQLNE